MSESITCYEFRKLLENHTIGWYSREGDLILAHCKVCPSCQRLYDEKYNEHKRAEDERIIKKMNW
jgi:hypothetical protein